MKLEMFDKWFGHCVHCNKLRPLKFNLIFGFCCKVCFVKCLLGLASQQRQQMGMQPKGEEEIKYDA